MITLQQKIIARIDKELELLTIQAKEQGVLDSTVDDTHKNRLAFIQTKEDTETGVLWTSTSLAKPKDKNQTITEVIENLKESSAEIAQILETQINDLATRIITDEKILSVAILRDIVVNTWPWGYEDGSCFLMTWLSWVLGYQPFPGVPFLLWPEKAAPALVWDWVKPHLTDADIKETEEMETVYPGNPKAVVRAQNIGPNMVIKGPGEYWTPLYQIAVLYLAEQDIMDGLKKPIMPLDSTPAHRDFISTLISIPKRPQEKIEIQSRGSVRVIASGQYVQLTLPYDSFSEAMVDVIRQILKWPGLRNYAALERLLGEQGSTGIVTWTLDDHMKACGYREQTRKNHNKRKSISEQIEQLISLQIEVTDSNGRKWDRRPLYTVERRAGSKGPNGERITEIIELKKNPVLYRGIRGLDGRLGNNWYPTTPRLAEIDTRKHAPALALGLVLPNHWRIAWTENLEYIDRSGTNILNMGHIKYSRNDPSRAWDKLKRSLEELIRKGGLGRYYWKHGDNTLEGVIRLYPPEHIIDRTVGGLRGELPAPQQIISIGKELIAWRKKNKLTQIKAAEMLGVGVATIRRAEQKANADKALSRAIRRGFAEIQKISKKGIARGKRYQKRV